MTGGMVGGVYTNFDEAYYADGYRDPIAFQEDLARSWWSLNKDKQVYLSYGDGSEDRLISDKWEDEEADE